MPPLGDVPNDLLYSLLRIRAHAVPLHLHTVRAPLIAGPSKLGEPIFG
jgi:hypothetical protein